MSSNKIEIINLDDFNIDFLSLKKSKYNELYRIKYSGKQLYLSCPDLVVLNKIYQLEDIYYIDICIERDTVLWNIIDAVESYSLTNIETDIRKAEYEFQSLIKKSAIYEDLYILKIKMNKSDIEFYDNLGKEISYEEFMKWNKDPANYRPELPGPNRANNKRRDQ